MADQISLLENIRDELKINNRKLAEESATVENGLLTQKQLLKAQEELTENQKDDAARLNQLVNLSKGQKTDSGKIKMEGHIKDLTVKMDKESEAVTNQENMMREAAYVRGVNLETFKEMRGNIETSDDNITKLKNQEELNSKLGVKDFKLQDKIAKEEKRKDRAEKKLEGGKLTRAKQQMKHMAKQMLTLEGIGAGIKGLGKGMMGGLKGLGGKGVKGMGGMLGLIMKGAMLALLPAILLFFNSPLWTKTKKFLLETALPAVMKFYHDAIVPAFNFLKEKILPIFINLFNFLKDKILPIFTVYIVETWNNIKVLFTDISDAFSKIFSGDILGGLMDLICGIGSFIGKQINAIATAIYNIIASIFGLEETDSVFGSIKKFFTDTYDSIVEWVSKAWTAIKDFFIGIFTWGKKDDQENGWSLMTFITDMVKGIKEWFGQMFKFDSTSDVIASLINVVTFVPNMLAAMILSVTKWLLKLFGFGKAAEKVANAEGFTIGGLIMGVVKAIVTFLKKIFNIDWGATFKKLISKVPGATAIMDFFGIGGKKEAEGGEDLSEGSGIESDVQTRAKIEEQRKKGNIADISGQVDPYGGTADAISRAALEKDVVAGNSGYGGNIITANQVSTTKQSYSQVNVSPVVDSDPIVQSLTYDMD